MVSLKTYITLFLILLFFACNTQDKKIESSTQKTEVAINKKLSKAETILKETISAHGGTLFNKANYAFTFRNQVYSFKNNGNNYEYTKTTKTSTLTTKDVLRNNTFTRFVNEKKITLTDKETNIGKEALNSVIYFATLPYKLNDNAVNAKYIESTSIKGKTYNVIEITFNKKGGGKDFDDVFYYWINTNTKKIDYLAYKYNTNNGGIRFRSAFNQSVVDGISFQDYINYKAEIGTALKDLPALYEAGKLVKLSEIKTENIINLNKN